MTHVPLDTTGLTTTMLESTVLNAVVTVGISACLYGETVRYDGNHKQNHLILTLISPFVRWAAFCPEVAANLGVPRPPINLLATDKGVAAIGVEDPSLDVTQALQDVSEEYWNKLHPSPTTPVGFIFKSRSPSCGLGSTPLHNQIDENTQLTDGVFAAQARKRQIQLRHTDAKTDVILVEDDWLNSAGRCFRFIAACYLTADVQDDISRDLLAILTEETSEQLTKISAVALLLRLNTLTLNEEAENKEAALERRLGRYLRQLLPRIST